MSLSDRLARAAQEREGAAPNPASLLNQPTSAGREVSIILDAHIPVVAVEPDQSADLNAICPTCSRTGELGIVDLARQTTDWSCLVCGTLWRVRQPASALTAYLR